MRKLHKLHSGFTLIEAIMVIVITGILSSIVAVFITKPVQGYVDSVRRAELTDAADVALRRMTRDIRLALPNSLRVTTTGGFSYIEFIVTKSGGRYRDPADGSTAGDFLSFTSAADVSFHSLGKITNATSDVDYIATAATPLNPDGTTPQDYIVIYNLGPEYNPANAYNYSATTDTCGAGGCNIARVSSVNCAASPCTVTISANPYGAQSPPLPSPTGRFQVVSGNVRAVTFACPTAAGSFTRYWNYGFTAAQPTAFASSSSALLATGASCVIEYSPNATGRNGLLYVQLTLADTPSGESVTLFQQIHVDNSP